MTPIRFIALYVVLICMAGIADTKLNQWLEENDVTHFSNIAPIQVDDAVHNITDKQQPPIP
ncbi:uncharacterized protein Dvar_42140 [Desulfosarcina variabilis str. Montpellier]|uniref:hypothetical protein n=1 Tax=Desulfosarcina variabilis TaxID=2300 RepID=UPI003AFB1F56